MTPTRTKALALLLGAFCLGAVVWASWLWESDYYWDEASMSFQGPLP